MSDQQGGARVSGCGSGVASAAAAIVSRVEAHPRVGSKENPEQDSACPNRANTCPDVATRTTPPSALTSWLDGHAGQSLMSHRSARLA